MNENIKQLPAEDVKKMLLTGQLDIERLDEEMLLYLLDYEISLAAGSDARTKFYKMCVKALSKFVDANVKDEELDAVVSSAYFLCFNKREQRRLLKRLQAKSGQRAVRAKRSPQLLNWIICAVAFLLLVAFLVGTFILYSERISGAQRAQNDAHPVFAASEHKEFIKGIYINTDVKQADESHLKNAPIQKVRTLPSGFEPYICGDRIWYATGV